MQPEANPSATAAARLPFSALVGILPLLLLALDYYAESLVPRTNMVGGFLFPPETLEEYLSAAPWTLFSLAIVVGAAVGWLRGFPRWSFSFLGAFLLVAPSSIVAPSSRDYGIYGALAWAPLAAIVVSIVLLAVTSWRRLSALPRGIAKDWTRLSFALLCLLTPLYMGLIHDSPGIITWGVFALVVVGSTAYLLTSTVRAGAIALLTTVVLIAVVPEVWLWWVQMDNPYSGGVFGLASSVGFVTALLVVPVFWPALIGLIRRATRSRSEGASGGMGG